MTDTRLLCCGLTTWDITQVVERLPGPDEKVQALALRVGVGGPAANAARTAAALAVPTRLVTALGSGPIAELVRTELATAGVEVVDLACGLDISPAVSTVLVTRDTGQRAVVSTNAAEAPELHELPRSILGGVTAALFDGHHLELATRLARDAHEERIPTILDGGSWKDGQEYLLKVIQLAVVSGDFVLPTASHLCAGPAAALDVGDRASPYAAAGGVASPYAAAGGEPDQAVWADLRAIAVLGPSFVARTAGAGPVRYLHGAEEDSSPVFFGEVFVGTPPGPVVDTLGAGDVLHGAFAAATAAGQAPEEALCYATALATRSVCHPGALGWTDDPELVARVSLRA